MQNSSIFIKEFEFKNIFGARALPRALRADEKVGKCGKIVIFMIFSEIIRNFERAARAEVRARQIFFSNSNSLIKIDVFCTKNKVKISKIDN